MKLLDRLAALKLHVMHLAVAGDLHLKPLAHRIDALGADAVRAPGKLVAALAIFAPGMQRGQHQLHAGQAGIFIDVHRNAAPVVTD